MLTRTPVIAALTAITALTGATGALAATSGHHGPVIAHPKLPATTAKISAFPAGGRGSGTEATCALWSQRLQEDQGIVDDAPEADRQDASAPLEQDVDNALDAGCAVIY